jgi:hypothetical protein
MADTGHWSINNVFSHAECDALLAELGPTATKRSRAGARHLMSRPVIASVAHEERLLSIAREALGPGATPYRATLFEKSGESNWLVVWHQDTALPLT